MQHPLIIALDFDHRQKRLNFLEGFGEETLDLKVGMEGFYREGIPLIEELKQQGHRIFLDLKLHDIPNTVGRAMRALAELEIDLVNVHAAGGKKMMAAARDGLEAGTRAGKSRPRLIGVTQLTSTSEQMLTDELLIRDSMQETVTHYAKLTADAGLDGVVCSALEVDTVHQACGKDFLTVTPGIRLATDDIGDQHRVVTPGQAKSYGSWGIVVGRSITQASDPQAAYQRMKQEWEGQS
ncbi:orotidine-5'-phosphate decarboxylase [Alkalicoccobacillus porphyridii]|uniref:Orotidine 5'-phosphate decarboxylase n=1 Tax=Alkalicoccobacillus porphyridii TaxID=2597270 RepID=A0A553ZY33_9BACI|nr:orotidine-5'-phosphate decarboxylase [Alkalicoccobacillus porphyridii]TSB46353.1 orotidine-5'-phosphate decarboxylase [Alkalicoccobacillus porphyridii]